LIEKLLDAGCRLENLVAKVFGGGKVLGESVSHFKVGERNTEMAKRLLSENTIPVVAASTGGDRGRRILFNTYTGDVLHQYINHRD
jgi:chemotaxis protein CheD